MISKKGEFSVAGGTWTTTQQTSHRTVNCSRFVGRQPEKLGWRHIIIW